MRGDALKLPFGLLGREAVHAHGLVRRKRSALPDVEVIAPVNFAAGRVEQRAAGGVLGFRTHAELVPLEIDDAEHLRRVPPGGRGVATAQP